MNVFKSSISRFRISKEKFPYVIQWLWNLPVPTKLHIATALIVISSLLGVGLLWLGMVSLSGLRAYVAGEATWSKAQKSAVNHLSRYAFSFNENDYLLFQEAMKVPLGDRKARLELQKEDPDLEIVRQGFLEGGNHPSDIDNIIFVFRNYRWMSFVEDAMDTWEEGDKRIERTQVLGEQIHKIITQSGDTDNLQVRLAATQRIVPLVEEVHLLDDQFTILEERFASTLTNGGRGLTRLLFQVLIGIFVFFSVAAIILILFINQTVSSVDRVKGEMISFASHQLRTPLTITNWYAEKLYRESDLPLEKRLRYLRAIYYANKRMIHLVEALLNSSRSERGVLVQSPSRIDPIKAMNNVVEDLDFHVTHKKLTVIKKYDSQVTTMMSDPEALKMVLHNILSNAVRYTPAGGTITVGVRQDGSHVLFHVSDTGVGISKDEHDKVFNKRYRAAKVKELGKKGSGLGLYIARSAVQQLGGNIWFESEESKGTTFYVTLPQNGLV